MKILVVQSGGPSPGSNPVLAGALAACESSCELYGAVGGWLGLVRGQFVRLNPSSTYLLARSPSPYLVTFRDKLQEEKLLASIETLPFDGLMVIGGEGSMAFLRSLEGKLKVPAVGVGKTIDNDLGPFHYDLGYPSSAHQVAEFALRMEYDAFSYIGYVEVDAMQVMGRDAGWLTLASAMAGEHRPDILLLPEQTYDLEELMEEVRRAISRKGKALIAVAEGVAIEGEKLKKATDYQRANSAIALRDILQANGLRTRFEWPGVLYRCVEPNEKDREQGMKLGEVAVRRLMNGEEGAVGPGADGETQIVPLSDAKKRYVPSSFVDGFSASSDALSYLKDVVGPVAKDWLKPLA
ncbi:MAG: 6-phosphofructokinase [Thermoprotei archaeon]